MDDGVARPSEPGRDNYHFFDGLAFGTQRRSRGSHIPDRRGRMMLYQFRRRICFSYLILTCAVTLWPPQVFAQRKKGVPPTVTLTSPTSGQQFTAPADITLSANASDSDGTIKKVEFFQGTTLLGTVYTPPYTMIWKAVGPGSYTLSARATDNANLKTTSSAATVNVQGVAPPDSKSIKGDWSSLINLPIVAIHMNLLPDGLVLLWQDDNPNGPRGSAAYTVAYVWDMAVNNFTSVDNTTTDVFCSGHAFLPNGQLLIAGGHNGSDNNGTRTAYLFDSSSNTWTLSSSLMAKGRWYPTVTSLANGEMLVVSGNMTSSTGVNPIPEVWQTNIGGGWRELGSASLSLPLYPWMHVAPNGKIFNSGPNVDTRYLDTSGTGAWSTVANHVYTSGRDYGSSVMYDEGKVIVMGGGAPTKTAEIIDLNGPTPSWQNGGSMAYARRQMNATLLPDGKVLVSGGSSSSGFNDATLAVLAAEMWDPATKSFSTMASMHVPRMYHSTTVLLPDGTVLSAGGGRPAATGTTDQPNAEIYSPPYLFQADGSAAVRPVITSVSATNVTYGQQFSVATPDAATITNVTWIRLSSTT